MARVPFHAQRQLSSVQPELLAHTGILSFSELRQLRSLLSRCNRSRHARVVRALRLKTAVAVRRRVVRVAGVRARLRCRPRSR